MTEYSADVKSLIGQWRTMKNANTKQAAMLAQRLQLGGILCRPHRRRRRLARHGE